MGQPVLQMVLVGPPFLLNQANRRQFDDAGQLGRAATPDGPDLKDPAAAQPPRKLFFEGNFLITGKNILQDALHIGGERQVRGIFNFGEVHSHLFSFLYGKNQNQNSQPARWVDSMAKQPEGDIKKLIAWSL